jgi:4'-phosphopantetheinyl transferase EntD
MEFGSAAAADRLDIAVLGVGLCFVGCRRIAETDADQLTPEESASLTTTLPASRRASGAARAAARPLLLQLGASIAPILKRPGGAPLWPSGVLGSLAHDATFAVAAVGRQQDIGGIGIDIEPADPLPSDVADLVAAPSELAGVSGTIAARAVFCAKEAVYKAVYPVSGLMLEYDDIRVDLRSGTAVTRYGHRLTIRHHVSTHIVALALAR